MMTNKPTESITAFMQQANHQEDYDPNAMPVDKARQFIRQFLTPLADTEMVALKQSLGRVLAADVLSPADVPNYDNSAMDGYAFNADDVLNEGETQLEVVGTVLAGKAFSGKIGTGECVRIMTGGMLPTGADTIVVQEKVTVNHTHIRFTETPKRGMNVRYAGEDLRVGQTVLAVGHLMRPADLGLIASLGIAEVNVYRTLKVAFFSTGDELVSIGQALQTGQVYDSNRYTLHGMLSRMGVTLIDMGRIADDPQLLEKTLLDAAQQADVIITSGGVSVGEADYMKQLLVKHGEIMFWKIAMKPGRPLAYGKIQTDPNKAAHYFGLPGNPVAVMVTFYQFVRQALLVMMGQPTPAALPIFQVACTQPIRKLAGRTEFQRGLLFLADDGTWKVKPTGAQGSAILSSMSVANCFIVLGDEVGNLEAGAMVQVQVLEGLV